MKNNKAPIPKEFPIVWGPKDEARFGKHFELNILHPTLKICSYDCTYCDLGPTEVRLNQIKKGFEFNSIESIVSELKSAIGREPKIDRIVVAGNGEPTLHPDFDEVATAIKEVVSAQAPQAKLAVLSNGAHLEQRKVIVGLGHFHEVHIKMDAGSDEQLKVINQPLVRLPIDRLISGCRQIKGVIIQSLLLAEPLNEVQKKGFDEWLEAIGMIGPQAVHLYTMKLPGAYPVAKALDEESIENLASMMRRRLNCDVFTFT